VALLFATMTCAVAVADNPEWRAMAACDLPDRTTMRGFILPVVTMAVAAPRLKCERTQYPREHRFTVVFRARTFHVAPMCE